MKYNSPGVGVDIFSSGKNSIDHSQKKMDSFGDFLPPEFYQTSGTPCVTKKKNNRDIMVDNKKVKLERAYKANGMFVEN